MSKIHGIKSTQHPLWLFSSQRRATRVLFHLWLTRAWWLQATPFASYERRAYIKQEWPSMRLRSLQSLQFSLMLHQMIMVNIILVNSKKPLITKPKNGSTAIDGKNRSMVKKIGQQQKSINGKNSQYHKLIT